MNMQNYPLGVALSNSGGRKTKANRHIRSERAKRRAFMADVRKLFAQYQKTYGIKVPIHLSDEELDEWSSRDGNFLNLRRKVNQLRIAWLGAE